MILLLATGIQKTLVKVSHNDIITQIYDIIFNHNDTQTRQWTRMIQQWYTQSTSVNHVIHNKSQWTKMIHVYTEAQWTTIWCHFEPQWYITCISTSDPTFSFSIRYTAFNKAVKHIYIETRVFVINTHSIYFPLIVAADGVDFFSSKFVEWIHGLSNELYIVA